MIYALVLACGLALAAPTDRSVVLIRRRPRAMSLKLVDMASDTDTDTDAGQRERLAYYLGRCFEQIGLLQSAHRQYALAVSSADWRPQSLAGLVRVAERIGDNVPVTAIAAATSPAEYPDAFAGSLQYLRARHLIHSGDRAGAAAALRTVSAASPQYPAAQIVLAVLCHEAGEAEEARDILLSVLSLRAPGSQLARVRLAPAQQLARLNLGRIYYAAHRYEEAARIYATVDGPAAAQAAQEGAWAHFLLSADAQAQQRLGDDDGLVAQHLRFLLSPEAAPPRWGEEAAQLQVLSARYAEAPAALWLAWFGDGEAPAASLPDSFFSDSLRDTRLAGAALRLQQVERELALIAEQPEPWRAVFEEPLSRRLREDRAHLRDRAGRRLLERLEARIQALESLQAMQP